MSDEDQAHALAAEACVTLLSDRQADQTPEDFRASITAAADDAAEAARLDDTWSELAGLAADKDRQVERFVTIAEAAQEVAAETGSDTTAEMMELQSQFVDEMIATDQGIADECRKTLP